MCQFGNAFNFVFSNPLLLALKLRGVVAWI